MKNGKGQGPARKGGIWLDQDGCRAFTFAAAAYNLVRLPN
jgi:hypothetical protein